MNVMWSAHDFSPYPHWGTSLDLDSLSLFWNYSGKSHLEMDDFWVPLFQETLSIYIIFIYTYIYIHMSYFSGDP